MFGGQRAVLTAVVPFELRFTAAALELSVRVWRLNHQGATAAEETMVRASNQEALAALHTGAVVLRRTLRFEAGLLH